MRQLYGIISAPKLTKDLSFPTPRNKKNATFIKKNTQTFCRSKNKHYLCIAIEKQMHS